MRTITKPLPKHHHPMVPSVLARTAILLFVFLFASMNPAEAQNNSYLPSSWSIDIYSGPTFGHFSEKSSITPHGGVRVRYSFNPMVSGYAGIGGGFFESADNLHGDVAFKNTYFSQGLGLRINVLRMISGSDGLSETLGAWLTSEVRLIRNDVTASSLDQERFPVESFSGNTLSMGLGAGLSFNLSPRVDIFAQANAHFSGSDLLDGIERPVSNHSFFVGGDAFINTSAGISIKLGRTDTEHTDWYTKDHRLDPLTASLQESIQIIEADIDQQNNTLASMHQRTEYLLRALEDLEYVIHSSGLTSVEDLSSRIEELRELLESEPAHFAREALDDDIHDGDDLSDFEDTEAQPEEEETDPEIYFIVAGVYGSIENAEMALNDLLLEGYQDAGLIRDVNRNLYMVIYGGHATFQEAMSELEYINREINPEAWIFQF